MASELDSFKNKMKNDAAARAEFVGSVKAALQKQGVNVADQSVLQQFGLHDAHLGVGGFNPNAASSAVITITS